MKTEKYRRVIVKSLRTDIPLKIARIILESKYSLIIEDPKKAFKFLSRDVMHMNGPRVGASYEFRSVPC